jgi:hypothetical protein
MFGVRCSTVGGSVLAQLSDRLPRYESRLSDVGIFFNALLTTNNCSE